MLKRHAIERDGTRLVYWTWEGGPPAALLLHGIGNYGRSWDFFADGIAGRMRLVAPDARGHGESGRPRSGYAPADFAADALAILDAERIDGAVVIGHSMGGLHAIELAATFPERAAALVIVDAGVEPMAEGSERARRLLTERPPRFATATEARAYLERTSPGYSDAVYSNRMDWLFGRDRGELVWRSDPHALAEISRSRSVSEDRWRRLADIRCPTLLVRGTRSNVLSAEVAERMIRSLRDGRPIELETGHNVALERPRELADAVAKFVRGVGL